MSPKKPVPASSFGQRPLARESFKGITWVKLNEIEGGDRAIGGRSLQPADVQKPAAG